MSVSYKKLWKLLIDKDMNKTDLRLATGLSSATIVRCRVMDWEINKPVLFMPPFEFKTIEG